MSVTNWIVTILWVLLPIQETGLLYTIASFSPFVASDASGNGFLIEGRKIIQLDQNGLIKNTFSEVKLGRPSTIDVSNPLKIMAYFPDFMNVIFLDNTLSPLGELNLYDHGFEQVDAVAVSNDFNVWLYDAITHQLVKVDDQGTRILQTEDFRVLLGQPLSPNFIVAFKDKLYINDAETGIIVFDEFGAYLKTIDIKGLSRFQVREGKIVYVQDGALKVYDQMLLKHGRVKIPEVAALQHAEVQKGRIYLLGGGQLQVHRY